jgi:hypothetical protein
LAAMILVRRRVSSISEAANEIDRESSREK